MEGYLNIEQFQFPFFQINSLTIVCIEISFLPAEKKLLPFHERLTIPQLLHGVHTQFICADHTEKSYHITSKPAFTYINHKKSVTTTDTL